MDDENSEINNENISNFNKEKELLNKSRELADKIKKKSEEFGKEFGEQTDEGHDAEEKTMTVLSTINDLNKKLGDEINKYLPDESQKEGEIPRINNSNSNNKDKIQENYYRRHARRLNVELQKSRGKKWSVNNQLGYRIVAEDGSVLVGKKFELSIIDVVEFLERYEEKIKHYN